MAATIMTDIRATVEAFLDEMTASDPWTNRQSCEWIRQHFDYRKPVQAVKQIAPADCKARELTTIWGHLATGQTIELHRGRGGWMIVYGKPCADPDDKCGFCWGRGTFFDKPCHHCRGTGKGFPDLSRDELFTSYDPDPEPEEPDGCWRCGGTGEIRNDAMRWVECPSCGGSGGLDNRIMSTTYTQEFDEFSDAEPGW